MTQNLNSSETELTTPDGDIDKMLKDFSGLLTEIENLSEKKKQLWKEIYENAIRDRQHAYVTLAQLLKISRDKSTELATHGRTIASMLERMSKSNDQLIRLAELIAKAESGNGELSSDDVFDRIRQTDS